jgi:hypothetical protein
MVLSCKNVWDPIFEGLRYQVFKACEWPLLIYYLYFGPIFTVCCCHLVLL